MTRELVRAEDVAGGFAALYPALSALETLGKARRGYFVEGLGGAQFAAAGALERLRAQGQRPSAALVLAAADPAQLYGAALTWPAAGRALPRRPGAYVVLVDGRPLLTLEPGGHTLNVLADAGEAPLDLALTALVEAVAAGRVPRLALERIDGLPAAESPLRARLVALGFRAGLNRLSLARRYG